MKPANVRVLTAIGLTLDLAFFVGLFVWYESGPGAVLLAEVAVVLLAGSILFALREHARAPTVALGPEAGP